MWKLSQSTFARSMGVPSTVTPSWRSMSSTSSSVLSSANLALIAVASSFQASTSNEGGSWPSSQPLTR